MFHFGGILSTVKNISYDNNFAFNLVYDLVTSFNNSPVGLTEVLQVFFFLSNKWMKPRNPLAEGVTEQIAREAFALAAAKLPISTSFVKRTVM